MARAHAFDSGRNSIFDHKYEILATIGRGRNSVVYHAKRIDIPNHPDLALKVLTGSSKHPEVNLHRMKREALGMYACRHKNVVRLYDYVTTGELCYLSMEFAEQGDLRSLLEKSTSPMSPEFALELTAQMLTGLSAIHRAGIVHADIKPENVLLTADKTVKIADFGVAVLPSDELSIEDRQLGIGTLDYLAPECLDKSQYSFAADLYSVGVTLFQLLTKQLPFSGISLSDQIAQKMSGERLSLNDCLSDASPAAVEQINRLLDRLLAVDPDERYRSAEHLREACGLALAKVKGEGPGIAPGGFVVPRPRRAQVQVNFENDENDSDDAHYGDVSVVGTIRHFITTLVAEGVQRPLSRFDWTAFRETFAHMSLRSRVAIVMTVLVTLVFIASSKISGPILAMDRITRRDQTAADLFGQIYNYGVLYDFYGDGLDTPMVLSSSTTQRNSVITLGVNGWSPTEVDAVEFYDTGKLIVRSNGMQLLFTIDKVNSIPQSAANGTYTDHESGRTGKWVLWQ